MIRLATEWAKLGHEVTNFVPTKEARRYDETMEVRRYNGLPYMEEVGSGFHEYVPLNLTKPMLAAFPYDAVVAWECPSIFEDERIRNKQKVRLTHMQVAHLNEIEMPAANEYATGLVALSEWAKQFLVNSGLTQKNLYVRPNGVDITQYPLERVKNKPDQMSFVYSSSPDRGLEHLLSMWPKIREMWPKANLFVGYGVDRYVEDVKWAHSKVGEMSLNIIDGMKQTGVIDVGKIGQKRLAELQLNATAWLYPADTIQATETGCITAIENMAAGNPCFMSDADCLEPEFGKVSIVNPLPFDEEDYLSELYNVIEHPNVYIRMSEMGRKFAESRDWGKIAPEWIDLFKEQSNG